MKKRALVMGAAGFIGSHVAEHCLKLGMAVVAVDDLSGGFLENIPKQSMWIEGDLTRPDFVESLWKQGRFDYVYHLGPTPPRDCRISSEVTTTLSICWPAFI